MMFKRRQKKQRSKEAAVNATTPMPLQQGLKKTRENFTKGLLNILLGQKQIDDHLLESIETHLLTADVGVSVTQKILDDLQNLPDDKTALNTVKNDLINLLLPVESSLQVDTQRISSCDKACAQPSSSAYKLVHEQRDKRTTQSQLESRRVKKPLVILVAGVNGSGKTTTIGKLAKYLQQQNKSIMLAAGDTFRAAAIEQLKIWGERNQIPVISQQTGSDSAAVIFDALQSAKAKNIDVLIADTAGRLHTQENLMAELKKIKRVIQKFDETAPHETLLVLDATTGQNALNQAEVFHEAINISGLVLTKLDGTAKGGIIFAIAEKLQLPIKFIGVGEQINDLRPFDAKLFVEALFTEVNA